MAQYVLENYERRKENFKLNFELECPWPSTVSIRAEHLNVSDIILPLLPAGHYRIDAMISLAKTDPIALALHFFVQVSDIRVWF